MKQKIIFLYIFRPYNSKKSVGLGFGLRFGLGFIGSKDVLKNFFFHVVI